MELTKIGCVSGEARNDVRNRPDTTGSANNIAVRMGSVSLDIGGDVIDRDTLETTGIKIGGGQVTKPFQTIAFEVELRGNRTSASSNDVSKGSASYPIEIDPPLRACGLTAAYTAESAGSARDGYCTYKPSNPTDEGESVTIYAYSHAKLYKLTGCKGNIESIDCEAGRIARVRFTFTGRFNAPVDHGGLPSITWLSTMAPLLTKRVPSTVNGTACNITAATDVIACTNHGLLAGDRVKFAASAMPAGLVAGQWYYVNTVLTSSFKISETLGGAAFDFTDTGTSVTVTAAPALTLGEWHGPIFSKANFGLGNAVVMRDDANSVEGIHGWVIPDRASTFSFDPESVTEATHPLWARWKAQTVQELVCQVGTDTGNRISIHASARMDRLTYSDASGRRIQSVAGSTRASSLSAAAVTGFSDFFLRFH